jgi:hypothetical protein
VPTTTMGSTTTNKSISLMKESTYHIDLKYKVVVARAALVKFLNAGITRRENL